MRFKRVIRPLAGLVALTLALVFVDVFEAIGEAGRGILAFVWLACVIWNVVMFAEDHHER